MLVRIGEKLRAMVDTGFCGVYDGSIAQFVIDVLDGGHQDTVIKAYHDQNNWFRGFAKKVVDATGITFCGSLAKDGGDDMSIYQFVASVTSNGQWDEIAELIKLERSIWPVRVAKKLWRFFQS